MAECQGWLVVHDGGAVWYCTEERAGRPCPGSDAHHLGGAMSCQLDADGLCPVCEGAAVLVGGGRRS
jgi:hypothetical protein